jgi:hypothetical protein
VDATQDLDPAATAASDPSSSAAEEFEGEMREFLRRGISIGERPQTPTTGHTAAEDMNSLIQHVSVSSTEEIERVISELQAIRDSFRTEGDRVQRATTNYAGMSQTAMSSMRIIADGLLQLKTPISHINHDPR